MKTYYEMTENVLQRAQTEIAERKRRRKNGIAIAATGLCMAMVLTVLGVGFNQNPAEVPTLPDDQLGIFEDTTGASQQNGQQVMVKVTYLSDMEDQTTQKRVSPDVSIPLSSKIWIRDIRGLTEAEVDEVRQEVVAASSEFCFAENSRYTKWEYPAMIATIVTNGGITLDFSDCSTVKNVDIKTTGVGSVGSAASLFGPNPETGTIYWPNVREAGFYWSISGEFALALHKDPTIPLESIRDTVTMTIDYENGTAETLIFDITVNEEGCIFVTQRGIPTVAA